MMSELSAPLQKNAVHFDRSPAARLLLGVRAGESMLAVTASLVDARTLSVVAGRLEGVSFAGEPLCPVTTPAKTRASSLDFPPGFTKCNSLP